MRNFIAALGAACIGAGGSAAAQDEQNFDGLYLGVYAGGGLGAGVSVEELTSYNGGGFHVDDGAGLSGGGVVGYNVRVGRDFMIGLEGELGYLGLENDDQFPPYVGVRLPTDSRASYETDFHSAVTARVGYVALPDLMFYAKAGGHGLRTNASYIDDDPTGATLSGGTSKEEFMLGFTGGAGLDFAVTDSLNLRLEYDYYDMPTAIEHTATTSGGGTAAFSHEFDSVHSVKIMGTIDLY